MWHVSARIVSIVRVSIVRVSIVKDIIVRLTGSVLSGSSCTDDSSVAEILAVNATTSYRTTRAVVVL